MNTSPWQFTRHYLEMLAGVDGVAFCAPTQPPLEMPTLLAVPAGGGSLTEELVAACRAVA
jgi:hypothetical protein